MKQNRLERVIRNMEEMGLEQLVVSAPASVFYLTGAWVNPGARMLALYVHKSGETRLFVNRLFALTPESAGAPLCDFDDTDDPVALLSQSVRPGRLGIDKAWPSQFTLRLMDARSDVKPVLGSAPVDDARMYKDAEEIALMRESSRKNDQSILAAMSAIRAGATEADIAAAYNRTARSLGSSGPSFPTLICFGANCAEPHHVTDDTPLRRGDSVILDVGLTWRYYASDMTRTVFYGEPTDEQKRVHELVCRANAAGRAAARPGVPLRDVDRAARKVIEDAGYGQYFIHRTGHGIGLEGHEPPNASATETRVAAPGMVFSVEPGVYLPGRFGVREEDLVLITEDGAETLNAVPHEPRVIPAE